MLAFTCATYVPSVFGMSTACGAVQIPLVMFLLTHAYFCLYHALSNIVIRRTLHATASWGVPASRVMAGVVIFLLAYVTALMETFTISQVRTGSMC